MINRKYKNIIKMKTQKTKKNTKVEPQPQAQAQPQARSAEQQVKALLREYNEDIVKLLFDEGKTPEEIIEQLSLKGATAEQVVKTAHTTRALLALFSMETAENGEIAEELGLSKAEVETALSPIAEAVNALKAGEATEEDTAARLCFCESEMKDLLEIVEKTIQRREIVRCYLGKWENEDIAEELGLTEGDVADIVEDFKEKVLQFSAKGYTVERISDILDYTEQNIINTIGDEHEEVKTLQAVNMQSFMRENQIGHRERLGRLTALRDTLMREINERGLADVSVDKLIALYLKTEDALRIETKETPTVATSTKGSLWGKVDVPLT